MLNSVRLRDEDLQQVEPANENEPMWGDITDTPRIRTTEEIEALIECLNHNLNERMTNRQHTTDSVSTLRRMRAARSRYLRQR